MAAVQREALKEEAPLSPADSFFLEGKIGWLLATCHWYQCGARCLKLNLVNFSKQVKISPNESAGVKACDVLPETMFGHGQINCFL